MNTRMARGETLALNDEVVDADQDEEELEEDIRVTDGQMHCGCLIVDQQDDKTDGKEAYVLDTREEHAALKKQQLGVLALSNRYDNTISAKVKRQKHNGFLKERAH